MFSENTVSIDQNKCVGCALCVKDCPSGYLYIENEKAKTRERGCIECGHCYAICPQNAVSMNDYDLSGCGELTPMTELESGKLLQAMKSRRSVRRFKAAPVEREKIEKILEAGRYSPTGSNAQDVSYTVLGSRQAEMERECVRLFKNVQKLAAPFVSLVKNMDVGEDFFFKGAPLVIVVSSGSAVDGGLASSYMELVAESLGLGVLYSGFFVICTKISSKLRGMLSLPKGHKVVTCMVMGYPDVKYMRIAPRKPLQLREL